MPCSCQGRARARASSSHRDLPIPQKPTKIAAAGPASVAPANQRLYTRHAAVPEADLGCRPDLAALERVAQAASRARRSCSAHLRGRVSGCGPALGAVHGDVGAGEHPARPCRLGIGADADVASANSWPSIEKVGSKLASTLSAMSARSSCWNSSTSSTNSSPPGAPPSLTRTAPARRRATSCTRPHTRAERC
jgi:hypothetical protein